MLYIYHIKYDFIIGFIQDSLYMIHIHVYQKQTNQNKD